MAICKLCQQERELRNSHIIPEFIYSPLYDDGQKMIGFRFGEGGIRSQLRQQGLYEPLLCGDCEGLLNHDYEQPNVNLWRRLAAHEREIDPSWTLFTAPGGCKVVYIKGVDYSSFKLLLLSILWRSSVSSLEEFRAVELGPDEEPIRRMLLQGEPGAQSDYPCIMFLYREPAVILPPIKQSVNGHLMYHFILTTVQVWFLVPCYAEQERIVSMALREDGSFPAMVMDPRETNLFPSLVETERATRHSPSVLRRLGEQ